MKRLLGIALTGFAFSASAAAVHKWVDENGKVHYSDQPPPGKTNSQKTDIPVRPALPAPPSKSLADKEMEFRKRRMEAEETRIKQEKAEMEARSRQQNCDLALGRLNALQAGGRIVRFNAQGEREFLGDDERPREIAAARTDAERWCKK